MTAKLIDGNAIAAEIREEISAKTRILQEKGIIPGLGVILVGDDPASQTYVRMKGKACQKIGLHSVTQKLSSDITQKELMDWVDKFNSDPKIHGFLVQLPLPGHLDEGAVIESINPDKDVDCFHPINVGKMTIGEEVFAPCTPAGIIELLMRSGNDPSGKHAVIVGRSNIVGKPLSLLLSRKGAGGNATVTICHSRTGDLAAFTRQADIVVAAIGRANVITGDMLKPGCVVIDVGVNRVTVPESVNPRGYILAGDVHFESASNVASAITPVPGGVGPMTITMLLKNTLKAAQMTMK
ncbi:MAG: bifunctional methylenetetrahydrofolate dehydrogenase/methenyltetrahydrofolate cyclohydrolase FolD [bacterium]